MYSTQALSEGAHHGFCQQHFERCQRGQLGGWLRTRSAIRRNSVRTLEQVPCGRPDFRISQGLRTPQKQAEYYCKWVRRSPADIDAAARKMERDGAPWLASVLKSYRNIPRQQNWLT